MSQTPDSGNAKRVPNGEFAERVIRNVLAMRGTRWSTLQGLSEGLTATGRPIPALGIARMLRGERRIDVDDLIALARVLDVGAIELLFADASVAVTFDD